MKNKILLESCHNLEHLPKNVYINNNKQITELNSKIIYALENYFESFNSELVMTDIEYAFISYLRSNIIHDVNIIKKMIDLFPTKESKLIGKFCYFNSFNVSSDFFINSVKSFFRITNSLYSFSILPISGSPFTFSYLC